MNKQPFTTDNINLLTGHGVEYLCATRSSEIIAVFVNGSLFMGSWEVIPEESPLLGITEDSTLIIKAA